MTEAGRGVWAEVVRCEQELLIASPPPSRVEDRSTIHFSELAEDTSGGPLSMGATLAAGEAPASVPGKAIIDTGSDVTAVSQAALRALRGLVGRLRSGCSWSRCSS